MSLTSEKMFENAIVEHLTTHGGWLPGDAQLFDRDLALFPQQVIAFLKGTQPSEWQKLTKIHGKDVEQKILQRLVKELELNGMLHVLRHGFTDYGVRFSMAFFRPESGLNPETIVRYQSNRLHVTRQVHYSTRNENSLDLVLSLNGLPVATVELKNHFTRQDVSNARIQYMFDRDPREPLFRFRQRALVHFAVDPDEVYMTTKLAGKETQYLPFNKGHDNGAGNPANEKGYKTAYLWENIWERHSWMDILARFIMLQTEELADKSTGKKYKKETLLFPRYHQLDVVREITRHVREQGAGHHYLVQHSAGSGKSHSIAWLAYRLSSLHDAADKRVFDCIIVVTDRKVLDQQLQNNIYQFEHKAGVVQRIDKDSTQLSAALEAGTSIIITTLQKFPFIIDKIGVLPERRYAVIVDEAHSSQGGEASKKMKAVLKVSTDGVSYAEEEVLAAAAEADETDEDDAEDQVRESMKVRGQQPNLSFFAFTATPKPKTLEVFGYTGYAHPEHDKNGQIIPKPFHLYSMRQAIEEGFILDVLKNYTTYELYFRLSKAIEDDPELNRKKAAIAIGRFVSLHPHNIAQKTEIIIEHFRQVVVKKIGGQAKAMVVTGSRLHAVRYYFSFKKYLAEKQYTHIRALVAFSGKVIDNDYPDGVTETELNKFGEKELPEKFATAEYQLLLVADKYQTGFDQPLLHTMYVDKKLHGVKAVQTLSRLNRTCPGKEDTFVLDFANDRQTILDSFQPYYELTKIEERTDPNLLYDLKHKLDEKQVYWPTEIENLCHIFFNPDYKPADQAKLYAYIDPAVDRFKKLDKEEQDEFKKMLLQWLHLYAFLAQIMPFHDAALEKFFAYGKLLQTKLPRRNLSDRMKLTDEVALQYYRLQKVSEGSILLEQQGEYGLKTQADTGTKAEEDERARLSEIIGMLNDRFGTDFSNADKLFFDQIEMELMSDEKMIDQALNNTIDNFRYGFDDRFDEKAIDRMEQNQEIFMKLFDDAALGAHVKNWMLKRVYEGIHREHGKG